MIDTAQTRNFYEKGGFRTRDFPTSSLGMESEKERKDSAESFLRLLLGDAAKKVRWDFKDPSLFHLTPPESTLDAVWAELESLNTGGINVHFAPILGEKYTEMGRALFLPPRFFAVDLDLIPPEFGGVPEEYLEGLAVCQRLELPFTYCVVGNEKLTLYWAIDRELPLPFWSTIQGHLMEAFGGPPVSLLPSESRLLPGVLEWHNGVAEYPVVLQSMTRPYEFGEFSAAFGMGFIPKSALKINFDAGLPWRGI